MAYNPLNLIWRPINIAVQLIGYLIATRKEGYSLDEEKGEGNNFRGSPSGLEQEDFSLDI